MTEAQASQKFSANELGLVLSGGGARGAYQAGVLQALYEIHKESKISFSRILTGVSAGAINAAYMATQMDQKDLGIAKMISTWKNLNADSVFKTDYASVSRNAFKLVRGVSLGGFTEAMRPQKIGLLNTSPLCDLLTETLDFSRIQPVIEGGFLRAVAVTATDYSTSFGVTFFQAEPQQTAWSSTQRFSLKAQLEPRHIMASTAIPIFFPPAEVENRYFGDGCLRNTAPLSPAIHLGAKKLIVVGVRKMRSLDEFQRPALAPSLGRVLSVLINAIFMDSVEIDLERLRIVNESLLRLKKQGIHTPQRFLSAFYLHPSRDLASLAQDRAENLPAIIRFLFRGLGTPGESAELLSYLLFEPNYCQTLIELGYEDTLQRKAEILQFLQEDFISG
ncbi:MAG: patatin-like phospholipase family protein, partial [Bdellovibrionales bacterium]|nr:patatin-like phospholipase family protein [Bdellovibrionales bacterium]